jgi:pyruvate/2-oxoglutarate dehydrogenase complex dihydrolipoamide acyltransferase (E2) component
MQAIVVPQVKQGVANATVRRWFVQPGQAVEAGQPIVELETEDAFIHVTAAAAGSVASVVAQPGTTVAVGGPLGQFNDGAQPAAVSPQPSAAPAPAPVGEPPAGVVAVLMPQVGNTMEEGTVIAWQVQPGDTITVGQEICEIETDKATMMIEATDAGRLSRIVADAGDVVPVKEAIAYLADDDAAVDGYLGGGGAQPSAVSPQRSAPVAAAPAELPAGVAPVLMPQVGNTMEEGTVIAWQVRPGDTITVGQEICEIETTRPP